MTSFLIPESYTQEKFENEITKLAIDNIIVMLFCCNNSKISKISNFPNLKILVCEESNISFISSMKNLKELHCRNCPKFTKIHNFPNLEKLNCSNSGIYHIPFMKKLEILGCTNCPNLLTIPNLPNLKKLFCSSRCLKVKFYNKDLIVNGGEKNSFQHYQGRLYQNTYRTYELLIF